MTGTGLTGPEEDRAELVTGTEKDRADPVTETDRDIRQGGGAPQVVTRNLL